MSAFKANNKAKMFISWPLNNVTVRPALNPVPVMLFEVGSVFSRSKRRGTAVCARCTGSLKGVEEGRGKGVRG
jgi:hypothetical protein